MGSTNAKLRAKEEISALFAKYQREFSDFQKGMMTKINLSTLVINELR